MRTIALSICAALSLTATAGSLDDILMSAIRADRTLNAFEYTGNASVEALRADNIVASPEVEVEHLWGSESNRWSVGVSQQVDWPGIYRARSREAASMASLNDLLLTQLAMDKALTYKLAILDVVNARARLDFCRSVADNLQRIADLTARSYDNGEATILDLQKSRIAVLDSRRNVAAAQAEMESLIAVLRASGADIPDADSPVWQAYPQQQCTLPSVEPSDYIQSAIATQRASLAAATSRSIKMQSLPSFSIGYVHSYEDFSHFNGLSFSFTLPSFSRSQRLRVARAEADAEVFTCDAELTAAMAEAMGQYNVAVALQQSLNDYRDLTGDNTYIDLLNKAFDGGELTVIDYITEVNLFMQSRQAYIDLQYRYNLALARLNRYKTLYF